MSTSTSASPISVYATPAFWERLWRTGGIQSLGCFLVAYVIYGHQPRIGASTDALVAFSAAPDPAPHPCRMVMRVWRGRPRPRFGGWPSR